jgi:hypothetical protein
VYNEGQNGYPMAMIKLIVSMLDGVVADDQQPDAQSAEDAMYLSTTALSTALSHQHWDLYRSHARLKRRSDTNLSLSTRRKELLATRVVEEVRAVLALRYPEVPFCVHLLETEETVETTVRVGWFDGPRFQAVDNALWTCRQHYKGEVVILAERSYSRQFLEAVGRAYCSCCGLSVPQILDSEILPGSSSFEILSVGSIRIDLELARWCERIDASDLTSLAFRKDEQGRILQSLIVLKKDYSARMFPHLAVIGRQGYAKLSGPNVYFDLYDVVRRCGAHRVQVVHMAGRGYWFRSVNDACNTLQHLGTTGTVRLLFSEGQWHY